MGRELQMIDTEFSTELLDRFIFAVEGRKSMHYVVEKPLTAERAIEYLGVGETTFYKLVQTGQVKQHHFKGLSTPFYFPSEMFNTLKNS